MFTAKEYYFPENMGDAYAKLISGRNNVVAGGCSYLKMTNKPIGTLIDLSRMNLDYIEETESEIRIGAMTTLRGLETSEVLAKFFPDIAKSVKDIVGVQFRNGATVGASIFAKYGFSDILTALLALDTTVSFANCGKMPLEQYIDKAPFRDILCEVAIAKNGRTMLFDCFRNTRTDYSVLNLAVSKGDNGSRIVVGARPQRAKLCRKAMKLYDTGNTTGAVKASLAELNFGSNMRGSAQYRTILCTELLTDLLERLSE